ncbi:MAG: hypothetical protein PHE27_04520 [Alphaproteobacteria bacterium]|nr:hypothetical protein [Alphaproteobacteria bacterium]
MTENPFATYIEINREAYGALIDELLAEAAQSDRRAASAPLVAARIFFIETGLAKGVPVEDLVRAMAGLDGPALEKEAERLPDKKGEGWRTVTQFTPEDRQSFAEMANQRPEHARWDALFGDENDLVLDFFGGGRSFADKIQEFIDAHNERAQRLVERELGGEDISEELKGMPQPQRQIARQMIRRDPGDLSNLQTCKPQIADGKAVWGGDDWTYRTRFGKYLQDIYAWELYEVFTHEANESKKKEQAVNDVSGHYETLREVANRKPLPADALLENGLLQIVVSRDAQKIAEASTGQRWVSCMARDGCNWRFVPLDIRAGSIAAYVVFKGDVAARYPLMRVLLKPYPVKDSEEDNSVVLVPGRVYGGSGVENSQTCDAFLQTLHGFVSLQNAGKSGEFKMDERLYEDGQVTTIYLQDSWTREAIGNALLDFQEGTAVEWMAELELAKLLHAQTSNPETREGQAKRIETYKSLIRRSFDAEDKNVGLPRIFYREMLKSFIGARPEPIAILDAVSEHSELRARSAGFRALSKGDVAAWNSVSPALSEEFRLKMVQACLLTVDFKKPDAALGALKIYAGETMPGLQDESFAGCLRRVRLHGVADPSHRRMAFYINCAMARSFPASMDLDTVAALVWYSAEWIKFPSGLSGDIANEALETVAEANPGLVRNLCGMLEGSLADKDTPNVREDVSYALAALVKAAPYTASRAMVAAFGKIALTDPPGNTREAAYKALTQIVTSRPDLASESLLDAAFDGSLMNERYPVTTKNANHLFRAVLTVHPEYATPGMVKGIGENLDEEEGVFVRSALISLTSIASVRSDLIEHIPLEKAFARTLEKTAVSGLSIKFVQNVLSYRPDLATMDTVRFYFEVQNSGDRDLANEAIAAFGSLIIARRDLAEQAFFFLREKAGNKDSDIASTALWDLKKILTNWPEFADKTIVRDMAEMGIRTDSEAILGKCDGMLRVALAGKSGLIDGDFIDDILTRAEKGADDDVRIRTFGVLGAILNASPEQITVKRLERLVQMGGSGAPIDIRRAAMEALKEAIGAKPSVADSKLVGAIADIAAENESRYVRWTAAYILDDLFLSDSKLITVDFVDRFLDIAVGAGADDGRKDSMDVVMSLLRNREDLANKSILERLVKIAGSGSEDMRPSALVLVDEIIEAHPDFVDPWIAERVALIAATDPRQAFTSEARNILKRIVQTQPDLVVPGLVDRLIANIVDQEPLVCSFEGIVHTHSGNKSPEHALLVIFSGSKGMANGDLLDRLAKRCLNEAWNDPASLKTLKATELLRDLLDRRPNLVDPAFVKKMKAEAFSGGRPTRQQEAVWILNKITDVRPDAVDGEIVDGLISSVFSTDDQGLRRRGVFCLDDIYRQNPDFAKGADRALVEGFMNLAFSGDDFCLNKGAASIVSRLLDAKLGLAEEKDLNAFVSIAGNGRTERIRDLAFEAIADIVDSVPGFATPALAEALFGFMEQDSRLAVRLHALRVYGRIAETKPSFVTPAYASRLKTVAQHDGSIRHSVDVVFQNLYGSEAVEKEPPKTISDSQRVALRPGIYNMSKRGLIPG